MVFNCNGGGVSWPQELHVFRPDLSSIGYVDITATYPDLLVWRAGYQSLGYSDGAFHASVLIESDGASETSVHERTMTIDVVDGQVVATADASVDGTDCPEYGEVARLGDGIPVPCESIAGVQRVLDSLGYPLDDDGQFGPGTQAAISAFQADHGLPVTGELDATTWYTILPPD